jgi:hypothetical protein
MYKKIAILQSNYIPWKGYFDLINQVDEFILYDDMQYTKNDWRNRNQIKTVNGTQWLSIPVKHKGKSLQKISETEIAKSNWGRKHWQTLIANYSKSPYFKDYREEFEALYLDCDETCLSQINYMFLTLINKILDIKTTISWSSDFNLVGDKTERLISLCQDTQASEYISGPAAQSYMNEALFAESGIKVSWMDYSHYPEYQQLNPLFEHGVSIIDLIFNEGANASRYMKSFNHSDEISVA